MKKTKIIIVGAIFCAFMCTFFIGCGINTESSVKKHISECTNVVFAGQTDNCNILVTSGTRESDYTFDGSTSDLTDFCLISLTYKSSKNEDLIPFSIIINDVEYTDTLEKNPYKSNFMCDINKSLNQSDTILLKFDDTQTELSCLSKDFNIDCQKAFSVAIDNFDTNLNNFIKNKNSLYECYIKILYKPEISENLYWYIFVKADKQYNFIIDVNSGNMIARY